MMHPQLDRNGVPYLYPVIGEEDFEDSSIFELDDDDENSVRWEFLRKGQPGMELGGYFKVMRDADEEISLKLYGARHGDGHPGRCYVPQLDFSGDEVRLKIEHDHDHGFIKIDNEEELTKGR